MFATTHLHISVLVFTTDLVCSRAFTYVAIDMLPKILLNCTLHCLISCPENFFIQCRLWRNEKNISARRGSFLTRPTRPDALLTSNESGRLEIGRPSPTFDIGFFCEILILYKILIWLATLVDLKDRATGTGSFWFRLAFQIDLGEDFFPILVHSCMKRLSPHLHMHLNWPGKTSLIHDSTSFNFQ